MSQSQIPNLNAHVAGGLIVKAPMFYPQGSKNLGLSLIAVPTLDSPEMQV